MLSQKHETIHGSELHYDSTLACISHHRLPKALQVTLSVAYVINESRRGCLREISAYGPYVEIHEAVG